jgi:hypothetical protein
LALTALTYYFIEKKIRHNKSKWVLPVLAGVFLITGLTGLMAWGKIIPMRVVNGEFIKIQNALRDHEIIEDFNHSERFWNTKYGGNGPCTLFYGDSNAQQYAPRIEKLLKNNQGQRRGALFITGGASPPLPGVRFGKQSGQSDEVKRFNKAISSNPKIDRVVISALWNLYFERSYGFCFNGEPLSRKEVRETALEAFGAMLQSLLASGKQVIVVLNIPTGEAFDPRCYFERSFDGKFQKKQASYSKEEFLKKDGEIRTQLANVALKSGAQLIDPINELCINGACILENDDGPIHHDKDHLRPGYVRESVKYLDETVAP